MSTLISSWGTEPARWGITARRSAGRSVRHLQLGFFAEFDNPLTGASGRENPPAHPLRRESALRQLWQRGNSCWQFVWLVVTPGAKRSFVSTVTFMASMIMRWQTISPARSTGTTPVTALPRSVHLSAGIPQAIRETFYVIPWNRAEVFENLAREHGHEIAGIIMNPIDYNNGCITTTREYLQDIRRICDEHGIIFILDEILSGFRTGISCGQGYYGVTPDLCLLGKALTNGFPLSAIAGKEQIMEKILDPLDPVIAGGTFSGNIPGCAAGLAALGIMEEARILRELAGEGGFVYE